MVYGSNDQLPYPHHPGWRAIPLEFIEDATTIGLRGMRAYWVCRLREIRAPGANGPLASSATLQHVGSLSSMTDEVRKMSLIAAYAKTLQSVWADVRLECSCMIGSFSVRAISLDGEVNTEQGCGFN